MGFREDFIRDLPNEPEEALVLLGNRAEEWMEDDDSGLSHSTKRYQSSLREAKYISTVLSTIIEKSFPKLSYSRSKDDNQTEFDEVYFYVNEIRIFTGKLDAEEILSRFDSANIEGIAELTADEKQKAHEHLNFIRLVIEKSQLDTKKKNALLNTLNKLSKEIDKVGTKTGVFFGFVSDLGFSLGDFGKNSKPLWDNANETLRILRNARARKENIPLPKIENTLQLPKPDTDTSEDE